MCSYYLKSCEKVCLYLLRQLNLKSGTRTQYKLQNPRTKYISQCIYLYIYIYKSGWTLWFHGETLCASINRSDTFLHNIINFSNHCTGNWALSLGTSSIWIPYFFTYTHTSPRHSMIIYWCAWDYNCTFQHERGFRSQMDQTLKHSNLN